MEGNAPAYVEAVAVDKGAIVFAGSRDEAMKLWGSKTRFKNLGGQLMMPGFIDGHAHLMALGAQAVGANLLPAPDGQSDTIDALVE
ncbi:MAG: amidohydrolase, partial [Sandarakinorhabdus sp.]|nr:amidohydrolase [Sandarakinorhabdus sp.]